jgi:general stress protein 26
MKRIVPLGSNAAYRNHYDGARAGQADIQKEADIMTAKDWLEVARITIEAKDYCFFITLSESGRPHARLMQPFKPEKDWTIWFGTSPRSRKMREIEDNDQITVAYENAGDHAYVTLLGRAQVERDIELRHRYWREEWARFWPAGPGDEDYVVIKFVPYRMELMSIYRNVVPNPRTQPAVLVRKGKSWVVTDEG